MVRIAANRVRDDFSEIVNRVVRQGERVVLKRNGKDVAAIVTVDDLARLQELEDLLDYEAGEKALTKMKQKRQKAIPWARIKRKLKLR